MRGTLRDQFRDKHPFFWVVVIAAVYAACVWVFTVAMVYKYAGLSKFGYDLERNLTITRVYSEGPAANKLQAGDVIRAINNQPATLESFVENVIFKPVGATYTLEVERNGTQQQVELRLRVYIAPDAADTQRLLGLFSLLSFCAFLIAIFAGLLRPADTTVRLFFAAFFLVGLGIPSLRQVFTVLNETELLLSNVAFTLLGSAFFPLPVMFHFFLRFPPGLPVSRFWEIVKWALYTAAIPLHVIMTWSLWAARGVVIVVPFAILFMLGGGLALVMLLIRSYRLAKEPHQKQRIKWIVSGNLTVLFFFLLLMLFEGVLWPRLFSRSNPVAEMIDRVLLYLSHLILLGNFVAWAYAILKHRVLDINVVIRRSLRYLLASRGFILIEALLAFALLSFVFAGRLGVWLDRFGSNTRTLITILGTVLMVLALQTVNRKIRPLIDRRFFRDAYDAQQILTELTSSLRATTNVNEVLELTTAKIQQALYAANVTIFLRNGQHDFQSAVSSDYHEREKSSRAMNRELHLPEAAFVVQRIHNSSQPAEIDWDDPYSPVATQLAAMANGDAAAQQEFDTLRALKTNLVLPLAAKDELLGVLALGPRAGDLPYSREDKRMLMNVAGQTALALENSRLIEQKIEIEAEHNRKTQELEEARRLQLSMLPKGNVKLDRLEITGAMRTATEVGGDYYDFLPLPDGRYCVVIGDATGHGMSAGLIVGMVKMGLTSRLQTAPNLQPMIEDLNAALKQSLAHRGVGMCLGATMIDPVTLQVELCSNGMPFPYHFTNGTLRALELKAQPLGFLKRVNVPTATLQLQPGEALIWVSDGFEERMNARHEEWGTEQVAAALTEICAWEASGAAMARELIAACDRASDGRSNDDDMTIVVITALRESA